MAKWLIRFLHGRPWDYKYILLVITVLLVDFSHWTKTNLNSFKQNCTKIIFIVASGSICLKVYFNHLCVISGAQRICYYLSSTVCRCGWAVTSIGCLMTVLFVWMVLSSAEAWRAVVAGNCCGGRLDIMLGWTACFCPALVFLFLSLTLSPCLSPLASPLNCPLRAGNGIV